jgi:hypothetical protein
VGDGQFVDDPLDTFGSRAVVEVADLQGLLRYVCRQGFEHHAAMNQSHSAAVLHEAFSNYFGWETHWHQATRLRSSRQAALAISSYSNNRFRSSIVLVLELVRFLL